jgi:multidrug efflux pump subunit AcrA (membrane-fusion protein)
MLDLLSLAAYDLVANLLSQPGAPAIIAIITGLALWQQKRLLEWRHDSTRYEQNLQATQLKLGQVNTRNKQLEAERTRRRQQVSAWLEARRVIAAYIGEHGAIVGLRKVRKRSGYLRDEPYEEQPHLGQADNIFVPVPSLPAKYHGKMSTDFVFLLLTNTTLGISSFEVAVFHPADAPESYSNRYLARIAVTLHERHYSLDIHTGRDKASTGAASLALDYLIARARADGVQALTGHLLQSGSIVNEGHRSRLYFFYIKKYNFDYNPLTNRLFKLLE